MAGNDNWFTNFLRPRQGRARKEKKQNRPLTVELFMWAQVLSRPISEMPAVKLGPNPYKEPRVYEILEEFKRDMAEMVIL